MKNALSGRMSKKELQVVMKRFARQLADLKAKVDNMPKSMAKNDILNLLTSGIKKKERHKKKTA